MASSIAAEDTTVSSRISSFIIANFLFGDSSKKPAETDSLIESGIVDSTGILELIEFLESEFGIAVKEEETVPKNLDSLDALRRYVQEKLTR